MKSHPHLLTTALGLVLALGAPSLAHADTLDAPEESHLLANATPPSSTESEESLLLADATPLSSTDMEQLRGGFMDPSGLIYNFAVNVRTDVNGADIFDRSINVSPTGPNGQLQAVASAGLSPKNIPSNLSVSMIGNGSGLNITDSNGNTTVLNQTASGAPASIVLNAASNRQITQSVDVTLALKNLGAIAGLARNGASNAAMTQSSAIRALGIR